MPRRKTATELRPAGGPAADGCVFRSGTVSRVDARLRASSAHKVQKKTSLQKPGVWHDSCSRCRHRWIGPERRAESASLDNEMRRQNEKTVTSQPKFKSNFAETRSGCRIHALTIRGQVPPNRSSSAKPLAARQDHLSDA